MEENNKKMSPAKKGSSLVSKGLSLSALTFISRILGLVREVTKARFLGTSYISDAFGIAFMIPNLFRRLFAENSISVAFIPTFRNYLEECEGGNKEGKINAQNFVSSTFTLVTFLTAVFVSVGMIFTPLIMKIFYSPEQAKEIQETIVLTRIMFPYLAVISVAAFFQGILNSLKIFSPSGFTPILFNTIVISATIILSRFTANPARAMAIGVIGGGCVQALFQLPFVLKNNWKVTFTSLRKAFSNPGTRKVLALIGPTIIGMAGYQINDIVSTALASRAEVGIVSSLQYSLRLQELILGICAVTIGTVILPDLTGLAKKNEWADFNSLLVSSIKIMALISIPVTFYSFVMGRNIIALVFSGGKFDAASIEQTTGVFNFHIAGLFFIAVNRIISQAFYAQQNTKLPTYAGLINFAVNITVAAILVSPFGGRGIALALSAASAFNTITLILFLKKTKARQCGSIARPAVLYAAKICVFSAAAAVPVWFMKKPLLEFFSGHSKNISQGIPVAVTAAAFGIAGVLLLAVTRDSMLKTIVKKITRK